MTRPRCLGTAFCVVMLAGAPVAARGQYVADGRNLVVNGGFEEDNDNLRGERMSCPVRPRVTYGQRDGLPDGWDIPTGLAALTRDSHSGRVALRTAPGKSVMLTPTVRTYAVQMKAQEALPRVIFSAWVKGSAPTDVLDVTLRFSIQEQDPKLKKARPVTAYEIKRSFHCPRQWTHISFPVPPGAVGGALVKRSEPAGLISAALTLIATSAGQGVTLDDVELVCADVSAPYTLVPNAGFEALDKDGYPAEWSRPKKSLRMFGQSYYVWRDWYHFMGENRGASASDKVVVRFGKRSFRMNAPPGDDRHIESAAIPLKQAGPRRLLVQFDYNSYLLANLMVQIVDENGKEVFGDNITPGSSGGWQTYRAQFLPRKAQQKPGAGSGGADMYGPHGDPVPLKACRVRIGVKGVNGSDIDDVNKWVNVNHAGVLWLDNVVLADIDATAADLAAQGIKTYAVDTTPPGLVVESIDLGERLYGENLATVRTVNRSGTPISGTVTLTLSGPYFETDPKKSGYVVGAVGQDKMETPPARIKDQVVAIPYRVGPKDRATVSLPYSITQLLKDWRSEYRVRIALDKDRFCEIPLGTWSQQALVDVEKCYLFANETVLKVIMNIGVTQQTLRRVEELSYVVVRARDNAPGQRWTPLGFQAWVADFNLKPLPEGYEGDNTNFYALNVVIDKLPVHPQTHPVRDHYVLVEGRDKNHQIVFSGKSPRFGRMEAHAEKLEPIKDVQVSPDNYLMVNGKPFFTRGHIWMQQNFGPSPFARVNTDWKRYGFNVRAGVQTPLAESNPKGWRFEAGVDELWFPHNTYLGSQMIAPQGPLNDKTRAEIRKWLAKPNVLGIHYVPWEGSPQGKGHEAATYAKAIRAEIGTRPLWISAGWYAPAVSGSLEGWEAAALHDWFMPENNAYFQPSQLDKELAPLLRSQPRVLGTYPNVFNDTPYHVQRFEHWTEIIRGHTGYMQIGKPGDPSLMAGMNGELRFIESFLFSKDKAPAVQAEPPVEHLVRAKGKSAYILASNAGPIIGGDWQWNTELKDKGKASHTGTALWSRLHDFMKDYYSHWYRDDRPFLAAKGDKLAQYVFVPTGQKVDCLILMARADGLWRHHTVWGSFDHQAFTDSGVRMWLAKDMHQMSWGSLGIGFCGPEGHDLKHPMLLKHTFTAPQFHRLDDLPPAGQWVRLEVPVAALGLEGKLVDGFAFISKGSKVWWERTLLVRDGKEQVLCDGAAGIHPEALKRVRFQVQGLRAGTKVKVCFEERDITAGDGFFDDDLSGEPGYQNLWVGLYGDRLGETGYYGDGVFYDYNWGKVAARLYEVPR
jgi:hypothetical protein